MSISRSIFSDFISYCIMLILYDIDINKNNNINADTIKYIFHLK